MSMRVSKSVLANGVRILTRQIPHVRSVSLGIWTDVGARDERLEENGLSHFIEHMLFKGTKKRSAYQIAKEFDAIGGLANAYTTMENTCYHAKVMDTHLATMVDLLSDLFLNPRFDPEELENERSVVLAEVGMVEDSPEEYALQLLEGGFWGKHSLGRSILGSRKLLSAYTADDLKAFYRRHYRPERIIIAAAGNVEHEQLVSMISPPFEALLPGEPVTPRGAPGHHAPLTVKERSLEQVHVCLGVKGLSVTDPKRYAALLMNTILGGNMSSRLFQHIRERKGLAYSVYSFAAANIGSGMLGIYAGVAPENALESVKLILEDMDRLREQKVSAQELADVSEYIKGNILLAAESTDNQMERLVQNELHFGREITTKETIEQIDAVNRTDILALAQDLFGGLRPALTLLGPGLDPVPFETMLNRS